MTTQRPPWLVRPPAGSPPVHEVDAAILGVALHLQHQLHALLAPGELGAPPLQALEGGQAGPHLGWRQGPAPAPQQGGALQDLVVLRGHRLPLAGVGGAVGRPASRGRVVAQPDAGAGQPRHAHLPRLQQGLGRLHQRGCGRAPAPVSGAPSPARARGQLGKPQSV